MEILTILRIAKELPQVIGIKDYTEDLDRLKQIRQLLNKNGLYHSQVISGNDDLIAGAISSGSANGVISVAANIATEEITDIFHNSLGKK